MKCEKLRFAKLSYNLFVTTVKAAGISVSVKNKGELMNQQIKNYIDDLFVDAPNTKKMQELKEELYSNVQSRYEDILSGGASEEEAYHTAIAGIGDVSSLFHQTEQTSDSEKAAQSRKHSAMGTAVAVMMYILCIPANLLVEKYTHDDTLGTVTMFAFAAIATGLLIFINMNRPQYKKNDDTIIEEFKEWNTNSQNNKAVRNSVHGIIWLLIVLVYLAYSFLTFNWHFSWIIFIAGGLLSEIVSLIFNLKSNQKNKD